ncbi:hypothetical protein V8F06_010665 [Rhypophila decipiens]
MDVYRKDGLVAVSLLAILPDSFVTMDRIEKVLTGGPEDLVEFRRSCSSNMNMVAIAGAIVAQIGITSLTLDAVQQAHWTATAFFVASLVSGVMSVYVSFVVQQELNGLIGGPDIADWLSRPLDQQQIYRKAYLLTHHPAFNQANQDMAGITLGAPVLGNLTEAHLGREVSVLSAVLLATPAALLALSLNMFVVGLGIYLGCLYTGDLMAGFSKSGSLGILIFYLFTALTGTFLYSFPRLLKTSEHHNVRKTAGVRAQLATINARIREYEDRQLGA